MYVRDKLIQLFLSLPLSVSPFYTNTVSRLTMILQIAIT